MNQQVVLPLWLFILILLFAAVTFASHFLFPSVRWFFRRRLERAVARLNTRLKRPIEPFKLARRHDMIQRLVYDPDVTEAVVAYARKHGVREDVAFEKARDYAREIVPSFSAFTYFSFGARLARWLAQSLYVVRTGAQNDAALDAIDPDATVIFIMNHRSNMDYVLVTTLAAQASALSYAVGEWARVWPLSRLIKSMGAYFIRRRARGNLYRAVLARYVQMATANGVTQAIFPEGGLSLDGRLQPPKLGLLSYVVEAHRAGGREVVFVPVAINYDRVIEDRVLTGAQTRGDRKFRVRMTVVLASALRIVWQRLRGRKGRMGVAEVVFGQPVPLGRDIPPIETLAQDLMNRIGRDMPLLFVPLVAEAMLRAEGPLSDEELATAVGALIEEARAHGAPPVHGETGTGIARARDDLMRRDLIAQGADGWRIAPEARDLVQFYANSVAHFFPDHAASAT